MKNSEQAIDKVLAGLRAVEAPTGLESRILLAMQKRAAKPASTGWQALRRIVPLRAGLAGGVALASLLCAVLWMGKPHRSAPLAKVEELTAVQPAPTPAQGTVPLPPRTMPPAFGKSTLLPVSAVSESDILALEEMRAPSQPAPPLPLTEQEKSLLRVARRHDPEQLAMLDAEIRSKQELQAKVEFQEFFEPTPPIEEKSRTESTDKKGDTR